MRDRKIAHGENYSPENDSRAKWFTDKMVHGQNASQENGSRGKLFTGK